LTIVSEEFVGAVAIGEYYLSTMARDDGACLRLCNRP